MKRTLHAMHRLPMLILLAGLACGALAQGLPSYEIVVRDGRFTPERLEVPAGGRIKLVLKNEGPGPLEFENDELRVEKVLSAGATSFVVLPPLKPGEHEFVDEFNPVTGVLVILAK